MRGGYGCNLSFVKKTHAAAERLASEGYAVYVVGEAGHPEVEATLAHVPGATAIDSVSEVEARAREFQDARRVGLVVQTTMSAARLREVVGALLPLVEELRVMNTICEATAGHQQSCERLAKRSDVMIVIGVATLQILRGLQRFRLSFAAKHTILKERKSFSPTGLTERKTLA